MKNKLVRKERFLKDPLPVRLGGVAANLARVKSFSSRSEHKDAVISLIEESKFFIEWAAPDAELLTQVKLIELQLLLSRWHIHWNDIWDNSIERDSVASEAARWSDEILQLTGLLSN